MSYFTSCIAISDLLLLVENIDAIAKITYDSGSGSEKNMNLHM